MRIVARRAVLFPAVVSATFVLAVYLSPLGNRLENEFARPAEFEIRHLLHEDPQLDPRIRIYSFGDSTLNYLNADDLSLGEWADVLQTFETSHARVLFFDKVFGSPRGGSEAERFVRTVKALPFPVIAGAFVSPAPISGRPLLPILSLSTQIRATNPATSSGLEDWNWFPIQPGYPYGPNPSIREAFSFIGHQMYSGNNTMPSMIRISRDEMIPAASFFVAKERRFEKGRLLLDGSVVKTDAKGNFLVNFSHPSAFANQAFRLAGVIEKARAKQPVADLPNDAVIIVLPNMFTGQTDMQSSPFGMIPGGFLITATINSVLTGNWISVNDAGWIFILGFGFLGALVSFFLRDLALRIAIVGIPIAIGSAGIGAFVYLRMEFAWLFSAISFLFTVLACLGKKNFILERHFSKLTTSMNRHLPSRLRLPEIELEELVDFDADDFSDKKPFHFGRYQLLECIGRGGMGEVYRAKLFGAAKFEKELAIKRLHPSEENEEVRLQEFQDEARLSSLLVHPNIAQVFQFIRSEDSFLLIMEYVPGKTLAQLLSTMRTQNRMLPEALALYVASEICAGLDYAHSLSDPRTGESFHIVHRDLSPKNVILSQDGITKIIDFGIAKGGHRSSVTTRGVLRGTISYMSPEQANGMDLDRRSDVFSCAAILFTLLTGKHFINGASEVDCLKFLTSYKLTADLFRGLSLSEPVQAILRKGLADDREVRYAGAGQMREDLLRLLNRNHPGYLPNGLQRDLREVFIMSSSASQDEGVLERLLNDPHLEEKRSGTKG